MRKLPGSEKTMSIITLQDAQARLPEIISQVKPGEQVIVTRDDQPVATIAATPTPPPRKRVAGIGKGTLISYVDDDQHLKDVKEYMP